MIHPLTLHPIQNVITNNMKPIDFPQSTKVLQKPGTMTDEECASLHVWSDGKQCVSKWHLSIWERIKVLFGQDIWLGVMSGKTQPPVFLAAERVFEEPSLKERFKSWCYDTWENIKCMYGSIKSMWHEPDKRKHFIAGFVISFIVGIFNPIAGFLVGCVAAYTKEWWDSKGHGTVELYDIIFTELGALAACPFTIIIHNLIF